MNAIEAASGVGEISIDENQSIESLKKPIESLSEYLLSSRFTGWSDAYGIYTVLKAIFDKTQNQDTASAFNRLESKVNEFEKKRIYSTLNHIEFSELLDTLEATNPTIGSAQLNAALKGCLQTLLSDIDDACSGAFNNQSSLSLIFGKLTAIGFILREAQLSKDLQKRGEEIASAWYFPRFGNAADSLKSEVNALLDLLKKCG